MIGNQVVSTMFDINTSIHVVRIIPFQDRDEEPRNPICTYPFYVPQLVVMVTIWVLRSSPYRPHVGDLTSMMTILRYSKYSNSLHTRWLYWDILLGDRWSGYNQYICCHIDQICIGLWLFFLYHNSTVYCFMAMT